jgi:hypothetical protein
MRFTQSTDGEYLGQGPLFPHLVLATLSVIFPILESRMARKPVKPAELKLRIPRGLHQMIETAARKNERSLNQEAILRLHQSFERELITDAIKSAAQSTALEIDKNAAARVADLTDALAVILERLDRPDLANLLKANTNTGGQNG